MIFLDTNVVSELTKPNPDDRVTSWLAWHKSFRYALTVTTVAEIRAGVFTMPAGKRRDWIWAQYEEMFRRDFPGRIYPFDDHAAAYYGDIIAFRKEIGQPISFHDAEIAAICRAHDCELATRNVRDFAHCGITTVNPWGADDGSTEA